MALNNLGLGFLFTAKDMASGTVSGLNDKFDELGDASEDSSRKMQSATERMQKGLGLLGAGAATLAAVAAPVAIAASFQRGMAEVSTLVNTAEVDVDSLGQSVLQLSSRYGQGLSVATSALYNTISASIDAADAAEFMDVAFSAAVGGVTDANTAVDALTTVVNGYGKTADYASTASDLLFTAVKRGKTTFPELAAVIGDVIPIANTLGVGFDQVSAAYATMTKQGINTHKATTLIKQSLVQAMAKQEQAKKLGPQVAKAFSLQSLEAKGLQRWMIGVSEAVGGSEEKLIKLLGSSEAASAFLAMTGDNAKSAAADLNAMQHATGASREAYEKMANTLSFQVDKGMSSFKVLLVQVGDAMAKSLVPAARVVNGVIDSMTAWAKENPKVSKGLLTIMAAAGMAMMVAGGVIFLTGAFMGLNLVMAPVLAAVGAFVATAAPFIAVGAAIAGIAYLIHRNWESVAPVFEAFKVGFTDAFAGTFDPVIDAFDQLWASVKGPIGKIGEALGLLDTAGSETAEGFGFFESVAGILGFVVGGIASVVQIIPLAIAQAIRLGQAIMGMLPLDAIARGMPGAIERISGLISSITDTARSVAGNFLTETANMVNTFFGLFSSVSGWIVGKISGLGNSVVVKIGGWIDTLLEWAKMIPGETGRMFAGVQKDVQKMVQAADAAGAGPGSDIWNAPGQMPLTSPQSVIAQETTNFVTEKAVASASKQGQKEAVRMMQSQQSQAPQTVVAELHLDGQKVASATAKARERNAEDSFEQE